MSTGTHGSTVVSPVITENKEMMESFSIISEEMSTLVSNLKTAEQEKLKKEREQVDLGLSEIKAETLAAKAAAAAAEEAKKAAETAAKALQDRTDTIVKQIIERREESHTFISQKYESPRFLVPLTDATVDEGNKYTFECDVFGDPAPTVSWKKGSVPAESNPDYQIKYNPENGKCSLTIEETFTEDSARYFCIAKNSVGQAETSGFLKVTGKYNFTRTSYYLFNRTIMLN